MRSALTLAVLIAVFAFASVQAQTASDHHTFAVAKGQFRVRWQALPDPLRRDALPACAPCLLARPLSARRAPWA